MRGVFCLLFLSFVSCYVVVAQEFGTLETNPASLRWNQIKTSHFKVLFPKGYDVQAQRMANTLEAIYLPEAKSLGANPKRIPIILQNQSSISNAFVSITPRRSEFYAMPSQDYNFIGNNDWMSMLAAHEYRHVVQFQHAKRGFNKLAYTFFGNTALAAMSYISVPQWFWEGDAVATETAFTSSGRGRIPNFDVLFRMNLQEGRTFDYDKQYLRSFKHNIPNHYVLGYHMVSYLREKKNDGDVWGRITGKTWSNSFVPFQFSSALKKESGFYVKDFYASMATDLKERYQQQLDTLELTRFETLNQRTSTAYTDYHYPQELEDGSILVMKSGIGDIERFVTLKNGEEKKKFTPGVMNDAGLLSAVNKRVVWNEYRYDPRWRVKNYSVIMGLDVDAKVKFQVSRQSRYASAALSPDGYQVATIETDEDYKTRLVVLDYFSGKVVKEFANPDNDFLSMPRWSPDGKSIVVLRTNTKGKALAIVTFATGVMENLTDYESENKGHPILTTGFVLYNSPISGIDNIYALEIATGRRYQVTCSKYGAYNPSLSRDGTTIYYNEQTKDGLDVVKIPFQPSQWRVWTSNADVFTTANVLAEQEGHADILNSIPEQVYATKKYSRLGGIVNPYSWGAYVDNTLAQVDLGVSSRDVLSTTSVNVGYEYDITEKTGQWKAGVSYQGFYPIIDLQMTKGNREDNTSVFGRDVKFTWKEDGLITGLRIPFLLTRSKYLTQLEISNSVGVTRTSTFQNEVTESDGTLVGTGTGRFVFANDTLIYGFNDRVDGTLIYNRFILSYSHQMKASRRDFNPLFAQYLAFEHYNTSYGGDFEGRLAAVRGTVYFPGLVKHHSLYFRGGYQKALESFNLDTYSFRNRVFKPRGHSYPRDNEFVSISTNYQLPVWYPDLTIGPLMNIQRIKANLFFDYGKGEGRTFFYRQVSQNQTRVYFTDNSAVYQSFGAEVTFDVNVIRLLPVIEVGLRSSYLQANRFNAAGWVFEFMLANIPF